MKNRFVKPQSNISATDFPLALSAMPINAAQRKAALAVVVLLAVAVIATAPFAHLPGPRIGPFIPVLQTAICLIDLITAALLFSQYFILPLRAILAIAAAYVCTGLFAFIQTLAFPGAYSANGIIGDGLNSAAWFFVWWHTAFSLAVVTYAITKDGHGTTKPSGGSPIVPIIATIVGAALIIIAFSWMALRPPMFLPRLYVDTTHQTMWANAANVYLCLLNNLALAVLWFRRRTILDLWLTVTLVAWWPNFVVPIFLTVVRFSVGWYVSRFFALAASSTVLVVLLTEMTVLYARQANSILLLRRERANRLESVEAATSAMAHEIRQPLTGIGSLATAAQRWLDRKPVEVEKAKSCLTSIVAAVQRSDEIITSVRGLFRKTQSRRTLVHLNDVSELVMQLARYDLLSNGIAVTADYQEKLPAIYADHLQLQQVMLNLIKNAIDAMNACPLGERRLRVAIGSDGHSTVSFYISDSGSGVVDEDRERIFSPFFTTKTSGMGLGLSICRTMIEEHGGTLRLTETSSAGSTFEITLPIAQSSVSLGAMLTGTAERS